MIRTVQHRTRGVPPRYPCRSAKPDRIFEVTLEAARAAGLAGRRRVLDSTPLYDAVATMDAVTLVRSAIRGLLKACDGELAVSS
jgi:hypothetical protein